MLFKCKHPSKYLRVYDKPTFKRIDDDFSEVTIQLSCMHCGEVITKKASTLNGGVDGFLNRKHRT